MDIDEIKSQFYSEFECIEDKFAIIQVLNGASFGDENIRNADVPYIWHPGVYVLFGNQRVWRVGRHFDNSRKRVLDHIRDNKQTPDGIHQVKQLESYDDAEVVLFNVINRSDYHWAATVEVYLENVLNPLIPALRQG